MIKYIRTRKAVIFVHWDDFVTRLPLRREDIRDFDNSIRHNLAILKRRIRGFRRDGYTEGADIYAQLLDENKFYVLGKRGSGFEVRMPDDPLEFYREANSYLSSLAEYT